MIGTDEVESLLSGPVWQSSISNEELVGGEWCLRITHDEGWSIQDAVWMSFGKRANCGTPALVKVDAHGWDLQDAHRMMS
jgi:hypothetical protein